MYGGEVGVVVRAACCNVDDVVDLVCSELSADVAGVVVSGEDSFAGLLPSWWAGVPASPGHVYLLIRSSSPLMYDQIPSRWSAAQRVRWVRALVISVVIASTLGSRRVHGLG